LPSVTTIKRQQMFFFLCTAAATVVKNLRVCFLMMMVFLQKVSVAGVQKIKLWSLNTILQWWCTSSRLEETLMVFPFFSYMCFHLNFSSHLGVDSPLFTSGSPSEAIVVVIYWLVFAPRVDEKVLSKDWMEGFYFFVLPEFFVSVMVLFLLSKMDLAAECNCGLWGTIWALESSVVAFDKLVDGVLAENMAAWKEHGWVFSCALIPWHWACKNRVELECLIELNLNRQLSHCMPLMLLVHHHWCKLQQHWQCLLTQNSCKDPKILDQNGIKEAWFDNGNLW
jgi:hypothetical protein